MSLGIIVMTDEGVVLAAESLGTLLKLEQSELRTKCPNCGQDIKPNIECPNCSHTLGPIPTVSIQRPATHTYYCQKLFRINNTTGMILVGNPSFGQTKAQQIVYSFINWLSTKSRLSDYTEGIITDWQEFCSETGALQNHAGATEMAFAGIKEKGTSTPYAQSLAINDAEVKLGAAAQSGIVAVGVHDILDKMFTGGGIAEYPVKEFPLQDAVEFTEFLITTQIGIDKYTARIPRVGGDIDIAVVHPNHGFNWVKQKHLQKLIETNRI